MKHHHVFGCPVFALENNLAAGSSIPHWSPHAHLGVNLGSSPSHARNVYLVLNLHTGCVFAKLGSHGRKDITKVMAITNRNGMGDRSSPVRGIGYLDTCKYPAG
jgi:hypothetical protein